MSIVNTWTCWTWTIFNEKQEKVLELEDMMVLAQAEVVNAVMIDLSIIDVKAVWGERSKGMIWSYTQRDLPLFMRKAAIAAAIKDSGDSHGLLYNNLKERALENAE
jgi:hypothetical protein